jgi:hypothetical protein
LKRNQIPKNLWRTEYRKPESPDPNVQFPVPNIDPSSEFPRNLKKLRSEYQQLMKDNNQKRKKDISVEQSPFVAFWEARRKRVT